MVSSSDSAWDEFLSEMLGPAAGDIRDVPDHEDDEVALLHLDGATVSQRVTVSQDIMDALLAPRLGQPFHHNAHTQMGLVLAISAR